MERFGQKQFCSDPQAYFIRILDQNLVVCRIRNHICIRISQTHWWPWSEASQPRLVSPAAKQARDLLNSQKALISKSLNPQISSQFPAKKTLLWTYSVLLAYKCLDIMGSALTLGLHRYALTELATVLSYTFSISCTRTLFVKRMTHNVRHTLMAHCWQNRDVSCGMYIRPLNMARRVRW